MKQKKMKAALLKHAVFVFWSDTSTMNKKCKKSTQENKMVYRASIGNCSYLYELNIHDGRKKRHGWVVVVGKILSLFL